MRMEDKSYELDKMLMTLVDLAKDEVDKAKQRGYFGKDIVEPATMVIALAKENMGTGGYGTYGNRRNDYPGYGNYGRGNYGRGNYHSGYGADDYEEDYDEGSGNTRGARRGRGGTRYE